MFAILCICVHAPRSHPFSILPPAGAAMGSHSARLGTDIASRAPRTAAFQLRTPPTLDPVQRVWEDGYTRTHPKMKVKTIMTATCIRKCMQGPNASLHA